MVSFPLTFNDPKSQISRSRHYLTLSISETVQDTNMFYNEKLIGPYAVLKSVISNDLE